MPRTHLNPFDTPANPTVFSFKNRCPGASRDVKWRCEGTFSAPWRLLRGPAFGHRHQRGLADADQRSSKAKHRVQGPGSQRGTRRHGETPSTAEVLPCFTIFYYILLLFCYSFTSPTTAEAPAGLAPFRDLRVIEDVSRRFECLGAGGGHLFS